MSVGKRQIAVPISSERKSKAWNGRTDTNLHVVGLKAELPPGVLG